VSLRPVAPSELTTPARRVALRQAADVPAQSRAKEDDGLSDRKQRCSRRKVLRGDAGPFDMSPLRRLHLPLLATVMGCNMPARPVADVRPPGRGSIPCGGPLCALYRRRRDRHETPATPTTRRLHDGLRVALRLVGILPVRPAAALLGHMQRDCCTLAVGRRISPNVNRRGLSSPFQARGAGRASRPDAIECCI
jgi:hypothetical protein